MKPVTRFLTTCVAAVSALAFHAAAASAEEAKPDCDASGEYDYVCGPNSAEDLVLVPGTAWIIASGFSGSESLYLIDADERTWMNLYPASAPMARQDLDTYGACPGSPDPNGFVAHGLAIRAGVNGHSTLYVVGHGEREAIEVFDVDANGAAPALTWTGCVLTPDDMAANSVAALADGTLLATIPLYPGLDIAEAFAGKSTGAAYRWSPGDDGFTKIEGTEMSYANGIEVSTNGKEFYIASSGLLQVLAFSNTNPARLLRSSATLDFIPDNLHMGADGRLLTAGMHISDPVCGDVDMSPSFKLAEFASCPRPFSVIAVEPASMHIHEIVRSPAQARFSNVTMALQVDDTLWIGTFAGDRVAYRQ